MKQPCVYILASAERGTLYTGVTSNLIQRVWQHRTSCVDGFTRRHHVHRLVWYEQHQRMDSAIEREKRIKGWRRAWKLRLVESFNRDWRDLYSIILGSNALDQSTPFRAFRIHRDDAGHRAGIETLALDQLSPGDVVVKAAFSSVNYKDALAGTGKGKILRRSPLVGGIDVAGYVAASTDPAVREGDAVLCTGSGLSETRDGGYSDYVRLPAQATIPLPPGLTLRESMIIGTAGFTAALALLRMQHNGQSPGQGPVVVTGASGGVGMLAIDILTRAGYEAHAITGKIDHLDFLTTLGARQVVSRHELHWGQRPLENASWAGAIDNVGDEMLAGLTRVVQPYGNIASCGMAGGTALATTVMPFIIRGVSVLGIASAGTPRAQREQVWERLGDTWKPAHLEAICTKEVTLDELPPVFDTMLQGGSFGRTLVKLSPASSLQE